MSDSLQKRCREFLEQYWLYRTHQPAEAQMTADDMLKFIESEINQSQRANTELVVQKQPARTDGSPGATQEIPAISSVQQEAPERTSGNPTNLPPRPRSRTSRNRRMLTHRHSAAGCIACDLTESEHVDGTQIPDPRAAAPTDISGERPTILQTCEAHYDCGECSAYFNQAVDLAKRSVPNVLATQITHSPSCSGCMNVTCEPYGDIVIGMCNQCGLEIFRWAAPQQTTAAQRGEK